MTIADAHSLIVLTTGARRTVLFQCWFCFLITYQVHT